MKTPQVPAQAGLGDLTTATASRDTEPSNDAQRPRDQPVQAHIDLVRAK